MHLIIGANGFIGSRLYRAAKEARSDVRGTYYPSPGILSGEEAAYLDLETPDFRSIAAWRDPEVVFLCHGISSLDQCKAQSERTHLINVQNTLRLLQCFDPQVVKVVFFSTSLVYAGDTPTPTEQEMPHPNTEYGRQKMAVEDYITHHFPNALILRMTKILGVDRGDGSLFTSWLDRMLTGQTVKVASDSYISPVFVQDLVRMLRVMLERDLRGCYNFGGLDIQTLATWGRRLASSFGMTRLVEEVKMSDLGLQETRPVYASVDSGKLWQDIGSHLTPVEEGLELMARNYGMRLTRT
jgi:dTDP-4-dehydrorhamnose reductase